METSSPEERLAAFIAEFTPEFAEVATAECARMRALFPGAFQLVYDNYNALAIGFSPTERTGDGLFSIAVYPRWVSLFILEGANLPDPDFVLRGSGNVVRYVVLRNADDLDLPSIEELMTVALETSAVPFDATQAGKLIIKSVSANRRPRRPG